MSKGFSGSIGGSGSAGSKSTSMKHNGAGNLQGKPDARCSAPMPTAKVPMGGPLKKGEGAKSGGMTSIGVGRGK